MINYLLFVVIGYFIVFCININYQLIDCNQQVTELLYDCQFVPG